MAYEAETGKTLWDYFTGTGIIAPPITYTVDGVQHVTVLAGWGGSMGLRLHPRGDAADVLQVGRIMTFKLDGTTPQPSYPARPKLKAMGWEVEINPEPDDVAAGAKVYYQLRCDRCHGGGPVIPDLRYSPKEVLSNPLWSLIVRDGVYAAPKGMPSFKDRLTPKQSEQIRAFIVTQSRKAADAQAR